MTVFLYRVEEMGLLTIFWADFNCWGLSLLLHFVGDI